MGLREGGGNCQKYLKRRWNRKEGRGNKDFENGVKLGEGVGALKRGGARTPLRTMTEYPRVLHAWFDRHY